MRGSGARCLALVVVASALSGGCAAKWSYRHGKQEAKKGNWDMAVAHLTKAVQQEPDSVQFRISLEAARVEASRFHYEEARKHLAADELEQAVDELEIATKYDTSNDKAQEALRVTKARIRKAEEAKKKASELETTKARAKSRAVVPMLSPRSAVPLTLKFPDASLEKVFETLSKLSGVNILFDEQFKDKKVNVSLNDVTFEEALDQLTFTNRLFYKVLDQKTLLIIPDTAQKRRTYEDVLVRTFYLESADPNETLTLVKNLTGVTKAAVNPSLAAITILGTFDEQAMAERIILANDKPKGEVVVEVNIMEVNRNLIKEYGLALSQYQGQATLAPFADPSGNFLSVRAHLLSSLNLSDFVVQIPNSIIAKFIQTDGNTRILAAPKLRAAEGKKTSLVIGSQVPVPTTTFQSTASVPGQVFAPTTSFQYRDVGVKLDLTPKITATGEITLEMAVEFSALGDPVTFGTQSQPTFLTRSVTGILRMRDGETTMLGGLINRRDSVARTGAAGVSDIPVLGGLLSSRRKEFQENEVLISITPRLVRGPELTEEDFTALYVGSKESIRVPSARPPLFGPLETEEENAPGAAPSPGASAPAAPPQGIVPVPVPVPSPSAPAPGPSPAAPDAPTGAPSPPPQTETPPAGRVQGVQAPGPGGPPRAMISPPRPRLAVGETKNLDVFLTTPVKALAVEVVLVYDPKVLEATGINPGSLLTLDGATVDSERRLEPGRVGATFRRTSAASGTGVVASVTFQALAPGSTPVTVESMKVTSEAGEETVPSAGVAHVVVGPAPPRQEMKP